MAGEDEGNMQKSILWKGLVLGIIMLFVGTSMVPGITTSLEENKMISAINLFDGVTSLSTINEERPMARNDLLFSDNFEDGTLNKWNIIFV